MPEIGATSEGFSTIVQPAAIAGATLQTIWLSGQFHGVISAQTPIGSLTTMVVAAPLGEFVVLERLDGGFHVRPARPRPARRAPS